MIGIIITIIFAILCILFIYMAEYEDSIACRIISVMFGICTIIGFVITTENPHKKQDIQYRQDILELKLLEQRIELFDLQIEQLKLNINQK